MLLLHVNGHNSNVSITTQRISVARSLTQDIELILDGTLEFANAGCEEALMPFLCIYYYGVVCDEKGNYHYPSSAECLNISTGVCQYLWNLPGLDLPHCDSLRNNDDNSYTTTTTSTGQSKSSIIKIMHSKLCFVLFLFSKGLLKIK